MTAERDRRDSVFHAQVQKGNVAQITATGEPIQGELRRTIHYSTASGEETSDAFRTERPVFANDDIFQQLLAQGATVGASPTSKATSTWTRILLASVRSYCSWACSSS